MTTTTHEQRVPVLDDGGPAGQVFEAATAEEALAEVTAALGADAEILEATKTLRGGFKGFFAREVVQLTARRRPGVSAPSSEDDLARSFVPVDPHAAPATPGEAGSAMERMLAQLAATEEERETTFGDVLRERLADELPPPASTAPAWRGAAPGAPDWSVGNLLRLGLPELVVAPCRTLDPGDDLAWIGAIADAVATLCRPLPAGDVALVGPRAHRLGDALGIRSAVPPEPLPRLGHVAVRMTGADRDQAWLAGQRAHRWVHLVIGGVGWRFLLLAEPFAVSWVGPEALPDALRCAAELGLVLGYGMARRSDVRRADPVDVALAVRDLVPRR